MYSQKQQKEFYEAIEQKKKEIQGLDISEDRKDKLYLLVEGTIQTYKKGKATSLHLSKARDAENEAFADLGSELINFGKNIESEKDKMNSLEKQASRVKGIIGGSIAENQKTQKIIKYDTKEFKKPTKSTPIINS